VSVSIFFPVESNSLGIILKLWLLSPYKNHETLAKEDVDFQEMDYSDDGDFENEDEKHLLDLVPSVLETMNNHGKVDIYGSFKESSVVSVSIFFPVESSSQGIILKLWLL
jgi:hypothetical protein